MEKVAWIMALVASVGSRYLATTRAVITFTAIQKSQPKSRVGTLV
jgi:hypothetical protein